MNFLHQSFYAGPQDIVEVTLDKQANVMLLDGSEYDSYQKGKKFSYYGGLATKSPFRIVPPRHTQWHLVVDLGGYGGTVRAGAQVLQGVNT